MSGAACTAGIHELRLFCRQLDVIRNIHSRLATPPTALTLAQHKPQICARFILLLK